MAEVRRVRTDIQLVLDEQEHKTLLAIIHHLARKLNSTWSPPARAYEETELQEEYASWVVPALVNEQEADIQRVIDILTPLKPAYAFSEPEAMSFIKVLNALEHVAGAELGITTNDWNEEKLDAQAHRPEYAMMFSLLLLEGDFIDAITTW